MPAHRNRKVGKEPPWREAGWDLYDAVIHELVSPMEASRPIASDALDVLRPLIARYHSVLARNEGRPSHAGR